MWLLMLAIALMLSTVHASFSTVYWAAPTDTGNCLAKPTACTVQEALGLAQSGDTVRLVDGTYTSDASRILTKRAGVTIEAEHVHGAVHKLLNLEPPVLIEHPNTTLRYLVVDGSNLFDNTLKGALVAVKAGNALVERNILRNAYAGAFGIHRPVAGGETHNVVIRYNLVEDTGFNASGAGVYIGVCDGTTGLNSGHKIYGNIMRRVTTEFVVGRLRTV